jgi:3-hydroxymyristoyl/3-hydroxydecanoyl-(acyl carrier protein) dehydratase
LAIVERSLAYDHPAASGHFPGNPIIPGAVLLSEALRIIEGETGMKLSPCRIRRAKFPAPARPGDRLVVEFRCLGASVRFKCAVRQETVLTGEVECVSSAA